MQRELTGRQQGWGSSSVVIPVQWVFVGGEERSEGPKEPAPCIHVCLILGEKNNLAVHSPQASLVAATSKLGLSEKEWQVTNHPMPDVGK